MKATDLLRKDHANIRRLERVIRQCHHQLDAGYTIPVPDLKQISDIVETFLDSIHYSREEDSYFPCVVSYGTLGEDIRKLLIEHEFSRRVAARLRYHICRLEAGSANTEPISRYMRTYAIYLEDHMQKEEVFFTKAEDVLSAEEEREMYEQFRFAMDTARRIDGIMEQISYLESRPWAMPTKT